MLRQVRIHESVVRVEQGQHASIVLEEVDEETRHLFLHVVAQTGELGEMAFALFIKCRDIADVEILAAELRGETANPFALQQTPRLRREHRVVP